MGDQINLGMHVIGSEGRPHSQLPQIKDPDRKFITKKIMSIEMPVEIKDELIRRLRNYPDGALRGFWDNLPSVIETLKIKRARNEI